MFAERKEGMEERCSSEPRIFCRGLARAFPGGQVAHSEDRRKKKKKEKKERKTEGKQEKMKGNYQK